MIQLPSATLQKKKLGGILAIVLLLGVVAYLMREEITAIFASKGSSLPPLPVVSGGPIPTLDTSFFERQDVAALRNISEPPSLSTSSTRPAPFIPPPRSDGSNQVLSSGSFIPSVSPSSSAPSLAE